MKKAKWLVIALYVLALVVTTPKVSTAEWFADLYFGEASTQGADVDVDISSSSLGFVRQYTTTQKVDWGDSFTFGGRVGYYFESLPYVGLALDLSYFQADGKNVDNDIVPMSFLVMLRLPLFKGENFPKGRLQPYTGIGPGFFFAESKADFRPAVPEKVSGSSADVGIDIRLGLAWQFHKRMAIFGEYRHTDFSIDSKQTDLLYGLAGSETKIKTGLTTNHFLMGISYRF